MPVTYSDADLVRATNENIPATLPDATIDQHIYGAEGVIDATMGFSLLATFDETKHTLHRRTATNIATRMTLLHDVGTAFLELEDAALTLDKLKEEIDSDLKLLADPKTAAYLRTL